MNKLNQMLDVYIKKTLYVNFSFLSSFIVYTGKKKEKKEKQQQQHQNMLPLDNYTKTVYLACLGFGQPQMLQE